MSLESFASSLITIAPGLVQLLLKWSLPISPTSYPPYFPLPAWKNTTVKFCTTSCLEEAAPFFSSNIRQNLWHMACRYSKIKRTKNSVKKSKSFIYCLTQHHVSLSSFRMIRFYLFLNNLWEQTKHPKNFKTCITMGQSLDT